MTSEEKNRFRIERWVKHQERAISNKWYATGRIDLLIISISGGGIYSVFETIKFIKTQSPCLAADITLLKHAGVFLAGAIIVNFISQLFGFYANKFDEIYANLKIRELTGENIETKTLKALDRKTEKCNFYVNLFNVISVSAMIMGILDIAIFNFLKL